MKQNVPPGVVIGVIVVAVLVMAVTAMKYLGIGQDPAASNATPEQLRKVAERKAQRMQTDIFSRPLVSGSAAAKYGASTGSSAPTSK